MLQSSCKRINNLIQSPLPSILLHATAMCRAITFFTHLLCKVCKFLGFAIQMWPSHRTHLFHRDINSSGYSQLKPAGNKAGCIRLCFRNTEANQIVHPPPVSRAAPACQKPHYSSMLQWRKRHDGVRGQHKRIRCGLVVSFLHDSSLSARLYQM